ncbi:MAG: peptidoglycan editing factor PgeF [Devosia sp.]
MSIPFLESPALKTAPAVRHGFFGRRGGHSVGDFASLNVSVSVGDSEPIVQRNRSEVAGALGFAPEALMVMRQVHSNRVVRLEGVSPDIVRVEADGMVTRRPGVLLGILTADCAPVLLSDAETGVIGAFHAGWRGAVDGIAEQTVEAMVKLGAAPQRIVAAIGPTISQPNYEVGPDFARDLLARHHDASHRINRPDGQREHFDLPGFVFDRLLDAGVGRVHDLGECTYAHPRRYFSHRSATHRQTRTGRQIAVIGLS